MFKVLLNVVFVGVSDASRLVGFYLQEAVGSAPAFMGFAVVGAFVVLVPNTVAAGSARFALHDGAHTFVSKILYVKQRSVHGLDVFEYVHIEYCFQPRWNHHVAVAAVTPCPFLHQHRIVAPFLESAAANHAFDFVSRCFHCRPPFNRFATS